MDLDYTILKRFYNGLGINYRILKNRLVKTVMKTFYVKAGYWGHMQCIYAMSQAIFGAQ